MIMIVAISLGVEDDHQDPLTKKKSFRELPINIFCITA